jgi:hypothetical protein
MDSRREGAPSSVVVALSVRSAKFMQILALKIAWRFDGCGGLCGVCKTCLLIACLIIRMYALISPRVRLKVCDCSWSSSL